MLRDYMTENGSGEQEFSKSDIENMSFEEAMAALEKIVRRLEEGSGELETSIKDYVIGTALKEHCQKKLEDAKLKVEKIVKQENGNLITESFTVEQE